MRKLVPTIALLVFVGASVAIAQPIDPHASASAPLMTTDRQIPEAPIGHRQPRVDEVPSEKDLMNPNDPVNKDNAALDRMINGICRGC